MSRLRDWIRFEFGRPTFGGFMAGLVWGSFLGGLAMLLTGGSMAFAVVSLATGFVGAFFLRPALEP